jgi:MscS family membrane protein
MALHFKPKLLRRILLLSFIIVIAQLIYWGIRKEMIVFNPLLIKAFEIIFTFVFTLLVITILLRFTQNSVYNMFKKEMEVEQRIIIAKLYSIALYSIAFLVVFWKAGVSLGSLTIFIGLIATGFAFAIRDLLLSFFSWFIILSKKPFQMGDYIKIGSEFGLVTRIGTFFFTLETGTQGEFVKVPNSLVLTNSIHNKGEERFKETIKIRMIDLPDDIEEKIVELGTFIRSRIADKELVKIRMDADDKNWFMVISYFTTLQHEHIKTAILLEVHKKLGDFLHDPKSRDRNST